MKVLINSIKSISEKLDAKIKLLDEMNGYEALLAKKVITDVKNDIDSVIVRFPKPSMLEQIEFEIINTFGFSFNQLRIKSKKPDIIKARHCTYYLLKKHTSLSYTSIASMFKQRHSNVWTSVNNIIGLIGFDKELTNTISRIENNLETNQNNQTMFKIKKATLYINSEPQKIDVDKKLTNRNQIEELRVSLKAEYSAENVYFEFNEFEVKTF